MTSAILLEPDSDAFPELLATSPRYRIIRGVLLGIRHVMIADPSELNQFDPGPLELTRLFQKDLG